MPRNRIGIEGRGAEFVPGGAGKTGVGCSTEAQAVGLIEKLAGRPDELERVPLHRIVAGRDGEAAGGMMELHRQLHAGRRHDPDVDHLTADRLEGGEDDSVEERPRNPAVAADDDRATWRASDGPCAEAGGICGNHFGGQSRADPATHTGDGYHQTFK